MSLISDIFNLFLLFLCLSFPQVPSEILANFSSISFCSSCPWFTHSHLSPVIMTGVSTPPSACVFIITRFSLLHSQALLCYVSPMFSYYYFLSFCYHASNLFEKIIEELIYLSSSFLPSWSIPKHNLSSSWQLLFFQLFPFAGNTTAGKLCAED